MLPIGAGIARYAPMGDSKMDTGIGRLCALDPRTHEMENEPTAIIGDGGQSAAHFHALGVFVEVLLFFWLAAALASVPTLLAKRAHRPLQMPWWLVVVLSAALGWIASNGTAFLLVMGVEAARQEELSLGRFAHYWLPLSPSLTLPWGWVLGLAYLSVCLAAYPMFFAKERRSVSRLFKGLAIVAAGFFIATWLPPWADTDLLRAGLLGYFYALVLFVLCAGVSDRILHAFQLRNPGWAFLVMFLASLLIPLALRAASDALDRVGRLWPFVPTSTWHFEWATLFAALFTAFWWVSIRARPVSASDS